jgi:hypothetical protein
MIDTPAKKKYAPRNRKAFTDANVLALKPKRMKQYLVWDEGTGSARGLAILVSPTGTKSYRCAYYFPGDPKARFMHLGRVGELALADARKRCLAFRDMAQNGNDPKSEIVTKSGEFADEVESYIKHEQIGRHNNKSATETQKVILTSCKDWHHRPVATLRDREIEKLLWTIRDGDADKGLKPRPYLANRLYSHLKSFFAWCAKRGTVKISPMHYMETPWRGAKRRERAWFKKEAADEAIKSLWACADTIKGPEGRYLKLIVLIGKRKTALLDMRWEQIDASWFWDAPPSDVKNKRLHGVPLPRLAQRVLHPRGKKGRVFPEINLDKLQDRVIEMTGITDFFWHGARHLAETKTAELRDEQGRSRILPHVRDLLFDHKPKRGSGAVYDHHDYIPEMRAAMETWCDHVERLVEKQGAALLR